MRGESQNAATGRQGRRLENPCHDRGSAEDGTAPARQEAAGRPCFAVPRLPGADAGANLERGVRPADPDQVPPVRPGSLVSPGRVVLAATLLFALWLRASGYASVFYGGYVVPLTNDSVYHVRRSLETLRLFPRVPVWDALLDWPRGAMVLWAPGYDFLSALAALALGAGSNEHAAAVVFAWLPVALGLLVVMLAGAVARRLSPPDHAARGEVELSRLLCAALPICVFTSSLGRTDHHVTEALTVLWLLLLCLDRFPLAAFAARPQAQRALFEVQGAGAIAFGLFTFSGATLYVAIAFLPLLAATLCETTGGERRAPPWLGSGAPAAVVGALAALALYADGMWQHRQWLSFVFPSLLQPAIVALVGAGCAAAVVAGRLVPMREMAPGLVARRVAICVALAVPLCALGLPALRELWRGAQEILNVGKETPALILEHRPLIALGEVFSAAGWTKVLHYFGPLGPLALVLAPLGIAAAARRQRGRAWVLAFFVAVLTILAARQSRFARQLGPLIAVAGALGLAALIAPAFARRGRRLPRWVLLGAGLALALGAGPARTRLLAAPTAAPRGAQAASLFLAGQAHPRADGTRAGALTDSISGAFMMWPARVPVVVNNLGDRPEVMRALAGDEREALAFMSERDLEWFVPSTATVYTQMVLEPGGVRLVVRGPGGQNVLNTAFLQRVPLATALLGGGGILQGSVPHLRHLLPRWVSADGVDGLPFFLPAAWVYERVPGAVLRGTAAPRATVLAHTRLLARGRPLPYTAYTQADEQGAFALTLPLPNGLEGETLATGANFELSVRDDPAAPRLVTVSEGDVRAGSCIDLGRL